MWNRGLFVHTHRGHGARWAGSACQYERPVIGDQCDEAGATGEEQRLPPEGLCDQTVGIALG